MIRVVIDPGVFVSVLIGSRGSTPDRVFNAWIDDRIEVIASPHLVAELRRVVQRPKFRRWFDSRTAQQLVERSNVTQPSTKTLQLQAPPATPKTTISLRSHG